MKKALAVIMTLVIVLSLSVTAFAAGFENGTGSMNQQMPGKFQQGQGPDMGGRPPMMNGQAPNGEAPADLPELPEMNGEAPEMNGQAPSGGPQFIDFDAMVENGVISQDTSDKIHAYMEENKPEGQPEMNGEAPEMGGQPPMMNGQAPDGEAPADLPELPEMNGEAPAFDGEAPAFDGEDIMVNGLLDDLLEAGVITQAEYDALVAAMAE